MRLQLLAAAVGWSSTTQTAINSQLGKVAGQPLVAAFLGYVVSSIAVLLLAVAAARRSGLELFVLRRRPRWYELAGGLCGAYFLAVAVTFAPATGVAMFFSLVVAGQLTSSFLLDRYGLLDFKPVPANAVKAVCVVVALMGACISSAEEMQTAGHAAATVVRAGATVAPGAAIAAVNATAASAPITAAVALAARLLALSGATAEQPGLSNLLLVVPVVVAAGALQPVQASLNSRLSSLLPHKLQAVAVSLAVSMAACSAMLCLVLLTGTVEAATILRNLAAGAQPWMFLGGLFMAAVVCGGVFVPSRIGTTLYYTFLLAGELVASLLYDATGAFGLRQRTPTPMRLFATGLVLVAALGQGGMLDRLLPLLTGRASVADAPPAGQHQLPRNQQQAHPQHSDRGLQLASMSSMLSGDLPLAIVGSVGSAGKAITAPPAREAVS
jgi:transporter family-2 protein